MNDVITVDSDDVVFVDGGTTATFEVETNQALVVSDENTAYSFLSPQVIGVVAPAADALKALTTAHPPPMVIERETTQVLATTVQAPARAVKLWIDYVSNWSSPPVLLAETAEGDVWQYSYSDGHLYRLISSDPYTDAFYMTFDGASVSGLVTERSMAAA